MKEVSLRDYQQKSVDALRQGYRDGHRIQMLASPTGSGKTRIACHLAKASIELGKKVGFLVDRVNLLDQASAAFDDFDIGHGIIQAGHWKKFYWEKLQIISAQTIEKRNYWPDVDFLIVDEANHTRKSTKKFIAEQEQMKVLGLDAAPFATGLGEIYTNLVNVTTTNELIKDGYLSPLKVFSATAPDMMGAKMSRGEWTLGDIEKRGVAIVGDIVSEWVSKTAEHFGGPAKTLVFSATVDHGEELCRQFNAAGYNFQQISYKTGDDNARREIIEEFRKPDSVIDGLVSCEVFTKGFDVPDCVVGISAKPYRKSFSSHIQQMGRIMRIAEGKSFGLWLDHSGNVLRFWSDTQNLFENGVRSLKGGANLDKDARKDPADAEKDALRCGKCTFVLPPGVRNCPSCGHEIPSRNSLVENVAGQMVEINGKMIELQPYLANRGEVWAQLCYMANSRGKDPEKAQKWCQATFRNLYGEFYRRRYENTEPMEPTAKLAGKVKSLAIRFAKQKSRQVA